MSLLPVGFGSSGNYEIAKSLRFRASASARLSRTPGSAGNRRTWTWSAWLKRGAFGGFQALYSAGTPSTEAFVAAIDNAGSLDVLQNIGGTTIARRTSTLLMRDPSAWYHVVVAVDTTQATANNRIRLYLNGTEISSFSTLTNPSQNTDFAVNASAIHGLGFGSYNTSDFLDGYLSEINFIDGQALTPSSFGETDPATGSWIPKRYSGTYGTNGFYLPFNDGANLTNLCLDRSGNSNNWTATNVSLTAGATYDWMDDTPTNNFAVWSPLPVLASGSTVTNAGLRAFHAAGGANGTLASARLNSGKWYVEFTMVTLTDSNSYPMVGITNNTTLVTGNVSTNGTSYALLPDGRIDELASRRSYGATFSANDICMMAVDFDNGRIWYGRNGTWFSSGNPSTGANPSTTGVSNTSLWSFATSGNNGSVAEVNFGQRPFAYTPPTGFVALCTKNLPAPTIQNPRQHFDVRTYVGNGGTLAVSGFAFAPDFVWIKNRSISSNHGVHDTLRVIGGNEAILYTNLTSEENTGGAYLSSFDSTGFTLNNNSAGNGSTNTHVAWVLKANGAGVTNTSGTITSTVSANTTAGFSIVTYSGTSSNGTVGHGLGVVPTLVIIKRRNTPGSGTFNWVVRHPALAANNYLYLDSNVMPVTVADFYTGAPTSSVLPLGVNALVNASGGTYVAYCFAETPGFSRIGSYTGNGSADGPFVWCGFRPRWVMVKSFGGNADWVIVDSERTGANPTNSTLYANTTAVEQGYNPSIDILSNGFKLRVTSLGSDVNTNGTGYIFMAFAESPFQTALAR